MTTSKKKSQIPDNNNSEVQKVYDWLLNKADNTPLFLYGRAGTGKTTIIKEVAALCSKHSLKFSILAPTGVAAYNVGIPAYTIHSFFCLPPIDMFRMELRHFRFYANNKDVYFRINNLCVLIIDEISMVRADILDAINIMCQDINKNNRPFGGIKVLMVGDLFQLPPIVQNTIRKEFRKHHKSEFFFHSKVISNAKANGEKFYRVELKKIHRQKDERFIAFLENVREGYIDEEDLAYINKRVHIDASQNMFLEDKFNVILGCTKDLVNTYNQQMLTSIDAPLSTSKAEIEVTIDDPFETFPKSMYPTEVYLDFKPGAQIMFVNNDKERKWVNGTLGKIVDIEDNQVTVFTDRGETVAVQKHTFDYIGYSKGVICRLATFTQYPFRLAWGLTIHKSQGLTFDNIVVDFGNKRVFGDGMVYVALSRCRTYEGISLVRPLNFRDIHLNLEISVQLFRAYFKAL